ncbi:PP0621 family protein [Sulfurimonas sp.]
MIMKLLIIAAVIWIVYIMFFKSKTVTSTNKATKNKNDKVEVNDMTECETCGVYVEIEEAILSNGKYYCSRECLAKAK